MVAHTGLPGLDRILEGIRLGDNVVLQVDSVDDYIRFVHPFCREAHRTKRSLIYFRFADHPSVIPDGISAHVYELHPEAGFENFLSEIFDVIEKFGKGAFYVFDCLSELAVDWYSDRMLGNFFMLTCPYLYDFDTVAYFALLRKDHTSFAIDAIHATAQVVLDIYRNKEETYVHPLKVDGRHSRTMYMLHRWQGEQFFPVTGSATVSEILAAVPQPWLDFTMEKKDVWTRSFSQAQEIVQATRSDRRAAWKSSKLFSRLLRMAVTRDPRLLELAEKYFDFTDVVDIGKRMIGTGLIGGKSAGMLLARAILRKQNKEWDEKLEPHDSFFIGSDVFYTYLIQNKCWWLRRKLNNASSLDSAEEAQRPMLAGTFPRDIEDQFIEMLNYFGQSPIIVRSSSLLEDAYGNAFSGKYESVFCANQGNPQQRLEEFVSAVRKIYASTLSQEALAYRAHWGLLDRDEQMAILVQRVSGEMHGDQFFPQVAGVGFSFNPFVWNSEIDPKAGVLRLVFGLGTRAVERVDDDYTRIVALNAPMRRPESSSEDIRKYTQHKVDILDLQANCHASRSFAEVAQKLSGFPMEIFASRDEGADRLIDESGADNAFPFFLTFESLLSRTNFVEDLRGLMKTIQGAYSHPVDIEFTANFVDINNYKINLLQCRPFQVKGNILSVENPKTISREKIILETRGPVIGSNVAMTIDRMIYVVPEVYGKMKMADRYSVARLIGRLTHLKGSGEKSPAIMLIGPGRWATTTPALGVPVSFAEMNTVSVLCEVAAMHEGLIPEVSLGTHFFNDLVEMDMLYFAVHPHKYDNILNEKFLLESPNALARLLPDGQEWSSVVRVLEAGGTDGRKICLNSDAMKQIAVCYLDSVPMDSAKDA